MSDAGAGGGCFARPHEVDRAARLAPDAGTPGDVVPRRGRAVLGTALGAALVAAAVLVWLLAGRSASPVAPPGRAAAAVAASAPQPRGSSPWTEPATLPGCAAPGRVQVVFPASNPFQASGPGAVAFPGARGACAKGGAAAVQLAAIGADDAPLAPRAAGATAARLSSLDLAVGTSHGQVLLGGARIGGGVAMLEGRSPSGLSARSLSARGALAGTAAYLGDVAVAYVERAAGRERILLSRQRYFMTAPGAPVAAALVHGARLLAVALDYRTDALVVWQEGRRLLARWMRADGGRGPVQTLGEAPRAPPLTAVISDDNRAIVVWANQPAAGRGGGGEVSLQADISGPQVRFSRAQTLDRFAAPPGVTLGPRALRMTRMSSETVMLAWTGLRDGRLAVEAAPVSLAGVRTAVVLSPPGVDSVLDDLEPGPRNEVVALWTSTPRAGAGGLDAPRAQLMAARGGIRKGFEGLFGPAATVSAPGPVGDAAVGVDPATDVALAAWLQGGTVPRLEYATLPARMASGARRRAGPAGLRR